MGKQIKIIWHWKLMIVKNVDFEIFLEKTRPGNNNPQVSYVIEVNRHTACGVYIFC